MQFSLFGSHSLFISFAVYFLASHHALGMPVHRKRKQKSQDEAERWSLVVPYFIIYVYSSSFFSSFFSIFFWGFYYIILYSITV